MTWGRFSVREESPASRILHRWSSSQQVPPLSTQATGTLSVT